MFNLKPKTKTEARSHAEKNESKAMTVDMNAGRETGSVTMRQRRGALQRQRQTKDRRTKNNRSILKPLRENVKR